jgi:hypothetical protein
VQQPLVAALAVQLKGITEHLYKIVSGETRKADKRVGQNFIYETVISFFKGDYHHHYHYGLWRNYHYHKWASASSGTRTRPYTGENIPAGIGWPGCRTRCSSIGYF